MTVTAPDGALGADRIFCNKSWLVEAYLAARPSKSEDNGIRRWMSIAEGRKEIA